MASRLSLHLSVLPVSGYGWHIPPSTLNSPAHRLGCPCPKGSSLYKPDILVAHPFVLLASWLLHPAPTSLSPFFPLPFTPSGPAQPGHVYSGLSQMSLPLATLSFLSQINSFPPYLGAVTSFPLFFISFCSESIFSEWCWSNWMNACRRIQTHPYYHTVDQSLQHKTRYMQPDRRESGK